MLLSLGPASPFFVGYYRKGTSPSPFYTPFDGTSEQFVKETVAKAPKTTVHLAEGVPYLQIVQVAKQQQADLIVIGTHGRTGLSHMMLGSVAERVVRTSEVPVLTIRSAS